MPHSRVTHNIVGKHIEIIRKQQKMVQIELSAALSVEYGIELSPQLISRIEKGTRPVRDTELKAIADILGVSVDSLYERE